MNALYLIPGKVGGTEIYLRELLRALATVDADNQYFVFTNRETGEDLVPKAANFHWKPLRVSGSFRAARLVYEQILLPLWAKSHQLDVMLNPGFTSPILSPCPNVTVFHDLQHKRHPELFRRIDLPFWRLALWLSAWRSARVIAVSEFTRQDVQHFYRRCSDKLSVIPHGVDQAFFALDRAKPEAYILCVSTLHPHKNFGRLLKAYARANLKQRLVCVGMFGFSTKQLHALRANLGLQDTVEFTGWIPRQKLLELFEKAYSVIYPSLFEGFGMPVVEAMAAGIPTACSAIPPLRELGGDAVLYFDPHDQDALCEAMQRVCQDDELRTRLSRAGQIRARRYDWNETAKLTLKVLTNAAVRTA